ncbi:MAG: L,D-transpeptidase [Patescibacteria group bacterium]
MGRARTFCLALAILSAGALSHPAIHGAATGGYAIEINLPAYRLYLYQHGALLHDYPIAIGKPATPTPTGNYRIVNKIHDPTWRPRGRKPVPPGPANPLGRWWLGLNRAGYGIHGCRYESSIGRAVSQGCIRLHNRDVEQLAGYVGVGTPVRIVYRLFALEEDREAGQAWLWIGRDVYGRCRSMIRGALDLLKEASAQGWHEEALVEDLRRDTSPGWRELPKAVSVLHRERPLGQGFVRDGRLWLPRRVLSRLPFAEDLAGGGGNLELNELSALTRGCIDWRLQAAPLALAAYPARLRRGEKIREGAARWVDGRLLVGMRAFVELVSGTEPRLSGERAIANVAEPDQNLWIPIEELAGYGRRLRWSEEAWEVVVE